MKLGCKRGIKVKQMSLDLKCKQFEIRDQVSFTSASCTATSITPGIINYVVNLTGRKGKHMNKQFKEKRTQMTNKHGKMLKLIHNEKKIK